MTSEEYQNEHGFDERMGYADEPQEDAKTVFCDFCGDPALDGEKGYLCSRFDARKGKDLEVHVHRECLVEWMIEHMEPEEIAEAMDLKSWGGEEK